MVEALKKKSFKKSLFSTIFLFVVGIVLIIVTARNAWGAVAGYGEFTSLAPEEINNKLVFYEVELRQNYGCFLEEITKNKDTHVSKKTGYYYVIYTGAYNDNSDYKYMAIKVPTSYVGKMEKMADATYEGNLGKKLELFGKIEKMSKEELRYFEEFWEDMGFTDSEIEDMVIPYYIDVYANRTFFSAMFAIVFLAGVAGVVWAVIRLVKGSKGGYLNAFLKDISSNGYTEATAESDLSGAFTYDKAAVKTGRLFTYYNMDSSKPRAVLNSKILWAYQNTITHRTNGIKTGTTYELKVWLDGGKSVSMTMPNEQVTREALQRMNGMFPWVVIGYTEELSRLFHKNPAQFRELRYNTVEHVAVEPGFEGFAQNYTTPAQ